METSSKPAAKYPLIPTVVCLVALLPGDDVYATKEKFQEAFFQLKKEYPGILCGLSFTRNNNVKPYSSELEAILSEIIKLDIMTDTWCKDSAKIFSQHANSFSDSEKQTMIEASKRLMGLLI
jgi:hypothetical protein